MRAYRLEIELIRMKKAHAAREKEIDELIQEQDWLRQFSTVFLALPGALSMGIMLSKRPAKVFQ